MAPKKIYVLYHENPLTICPDGIASAYAAWTKFAENATYIPVKYNEPFPDIEMDSDTEIYILDFSYSREILVGIQTIVSKIIVIDHHDTAKNELAGLDFAMFDMSKSGAVASWEYFNPELSVPRILMLVQDRDLWLFEHEYTKPITAAIYSSPHKRDMLYWGSLVNSFAFYNEELTRGKTILEYNNSEINDFVQNKDYDIKLIHGHRVAVYNATTLISERAAALLAVEELKLDYVMSYLIDKFGNVNFSFRTLPNKNINVGDIAKRYGGGGKECTAGAGMKGVIGRDTLARILENDLLNILDGFTTKPKSKPNWITKQD